jgi:hypothetical protein
MEFPQDTRQDWPMMQHSAGIIVLFEAGGKWFCMSPPPLAPGMVWEEEE